MTAGAGLIWDLLAKDNASPAFLRVAGAADKAAASTERATKSMGLSAARMGKVGASLTKHVTLPVLALGAVSVAQAAKWQKSMTLIQTAGGETAAKAAELSTGLKKLATETGTSLDELGEGIYTVAKAGAQKWSAVDQLLVMKAAAQGAKAENVSLGIATDALSTVMLDYHTKASGAVAVENQLIRASGLAKTNFAEFSTALANVTPIAAATGLSFKEIGGAIATMTQHGVSARQATENLRNLIFNLAGQNNIASQAMQQLGIDTVDLAKNLGKRGLSGTLAIVDKAMKAHTKNGLVVVDIHKAAALATKSLNSMLGDMNGKLENQSRGLLKGTTGISEYTKYAKKLGGAQGASALQFLALYKNSLGFSNQLRSGKGTLTTTVQQYQKMLGGMTGAAVAMQIAGKYAKDNARNVREVGKAALEAGTDVLGWNKTQETLSVKMDKAKASLQVMAVEIGTALIPAVSKIVGWVSKAVHWFDNLSGTQKKVIGWSLGIMAALGPILSIGSRLALVGRGISTFAANAGTKIATIAGASERTAARVGSITRGMVRGVSGILAGGVAAQVGGNSKGGWLTSIMLGTAGGWALGGPVGAAVGGVSAAIFKGIGLWNDHKEAAKRAAAAEKTVVDNLTSAIEQDNGALGTNLRLMITRTLQGKGVLDQAQKLGLNLADVVASSMGNTSAANRISGALGNLMAQTETLLEQFERKHGITSKKAMSAALAGKNFDLRQPGDQAGHLSKGDLAQFRALAAQEGLIIKFKNSMQLAGSEIDHAKAKADQFAHALNDSRVATGKYSEQMIALGRHASIAVDSNGQLSRSLNGTTVAGEHNRQTLVALANAAQLDAETTLGNALQHHSFADAVKIASGRLNDHISQLEKAARKAGFNKQQVSDLVEMYRHIPSSVLTHIKKTGLLPSDIQAIIDKMKQLDGMRAAIYVSTVTGTKMNDPRLNGHATGTNGKGLPDGVSAVGERGPELAVKHGRHVEILSNRQSKHFLAATGMRAPGFADGTGVTSTTVHGKKIWSFGGQQYGSRMAAENAQSRAADSAAADRATAVEGVHTGALGLLAAAKAFLSTASDLRSASKELRDAAKTAKVSAAEAQRLARQQARLAGLGRKRDSVRERLGTAPTAPTAYERLASAKQNYADKRQSVKSAITGTFDISQAGQQPFGEPVSLRSIRAQLAKAVSNAHRFSVALRRLGKAGLNRGLLSQLAEAGPSALPQALALMSATPKELASINGQYRQLNASGSNAGKYVADQMYNAKKGSPYYKVGVGYAQGVVNGLLSKESALTKAIRRLANKMVAQLRKSLDMHSPSRRLYSEARLAFSGYENGIQSKHGDIARAAGRIGNASIPTRGSHASGGGGYVHIEKQELHVHYPEDGDLGGALKQLSRMTVHQVRAASQELGR